MHSAVPFAAVRLGQLLRLPLSLSLRALPLPKSMTCGPTDRQRTAAGSAAVTTRQRRRHWNRTHHAMRVTTKRSLLEHLRRQLVVALEKGDQSHGGDVSTIRGSCAHIAALRVPVHHKDGVVKHACGQRAALHAGHGAAQLRRKERQERGGEEGREGWRHARAAAAGGAAAAARGLHRPLYPPLHGTALRRHHPLGQVLRINYGLSARQTSGDTCTV